jgi:ABC-2 type transport system permease protein
MRGLLATSRAAFLEAAANRAALLSQMAVMIVNDGVWIVFWALFFRRTGELGGWDLDGIIVLQSVLTASGGIALGLVANARRVGTLAVEGGLDPVLTLPTSTLGHVLARRVEPTNLGDLAFGVVLFAVAGHPTPGRVALFVVVVLASATLMTGFLVLTGSLAFFAGRSESGELGFHAMVLLGSYPVDIFAGTAKVLLYSVIPAAFVSTVPARLIEDVDAGQAIALLGVSGGVALAAALVFRAGLRRYTSGAVWTRA